MLGGAKQKMAERMMSQITPSETPIARAAVGTLTEYEARQTTALVELIEAADVDAQLEYDRERRAQMLLGLIDAIADRRVQEWWFDVVGPQVMDNPDKARQYAGLDAEGWREQIREWYSLHYEAGTISTPIDEATPGEIGDVAARHVRDVYGLSLPDFVATVVNWHRGEQIQPILAGPIERNNQVIRNVADGIDDT